MSTEMKLIEINGYTWQHFVGDEGQDVYIAQFMVGEDKLLGKLPSEEQFDILIDGDADVYLPSATLGVSELTEDRVALKFRKNVFTPEEQLGAYEGLYDAAQESNNRGLAAGSENKPETSGKREWVYKFQEEVLEYFIKGQPHELDGTPGLVFIKESFADRMKETSTRGSVWVRSQVLKEFEEYDGFFEEAIERMLGMSIGEATAFAKNMKEKMISGTSYATPIWSGIAGFYGRYPRIPWGRATSYTERHMDKFEKCYPFARKLEAEFARLMPVRHGFQKNYVSTFDKRYLIGEDTSFTTITVNTTQSDRNARMACHRDAGSLNEGFSNLTVVTKDGKDWNGGYLVTPEVRMAINVRPGDLLLVDNMRVIHGNTPIEAPDSGVQDMLRMSLVFYAREDMKVLGEKEYEDLREMFVNTRKKDESNKHWRPFWNGVSPGMWDEQEWYDFLEEKGGVDMLVKYHPEAKAEPAPTLDAFF